ncbi:MAG: CPBP family intramembrane metalloprotease [Alphaproteobacteria bacterium]|nr:CPBP family intramembrane metalloprotease [Alphaproteobacteria bacterium]
MTPRAALGAVFGVLYWRHGLESAMTAHMAYNLVVFYLIVLVV